MILCVGTTGSGKSVLLRYLLASEHTPSPSTASSSSGGVGGVSAAVIARANSNKDGADGIVDAKIMVNSIPTTGTNLVKLTKPKSKKNKDSPPEIVVIREVGGTMAPLWHSYIEPGKTRAVLYIVDSSSPETIGAATIYLIELLSQPGLESSQVMVVFTKTELPSARNLNELRALMRMEQICATSKQVVRHTTFNAEAISRAVAGPEDETAAADKAAREALRELHHWCLLFASSKDKQ